MVLGGKNDHAQTGSRILLFGVGNSGDGNGNLDVDREKNGAIAVAGHGREDGFVLGRSTKWLQRMRSPNRMSDISYVVGVNRL